MSLKIVHDLSKLTPEEVAQYLRDVSEFIGLDPNLNGLDTIWMQNEGGPGQSLVVYARRGTAEILREKHGISINSLTSVEVKGSIIFTASGTNKDGRHEIATGAKNIANVNGKALDDAIMTASTRALRRLTMQYTKLGILDVSEVESVVGSTVNPAAGAALAGSPTVIPPVPTTVNNAPGKDITEKELFTSRTTTAIQPTELGPAQYSSPAEYDAYQKKIHDDAAAFLAAKAAEKAAPPITIPTASPLEPAVTPEPEAAQKAAKRTRKPKNTVVLGDVEPEIVNNAPPPISVPAVGPDPVQSVAVVVDAYQNLPSKPAPPADFPGKPTDSQMAEYRKAISVYTSELPSSENLGSVQKMRAFITKMSGNPPQQMTTDQWEEILGWFAAFVAKNTTKGLIKYINDSLGVR